ncbi:MAG: hydrogenase maturation nickel metallochaperone HypA [Deltaproteobacteria bacterium]|nr:hydrogenase maturation nickel metallochaperone HypA [Deltaproteobacteria bacterium]
MHEASVAKDLLDLVLAACGGQRILRVGLELGELSTVVPDALRFAWEVVPAGTLAEGSAVDIARIPVRVRCPSCSFTGHPVSIFEGCPRCGTISVEVLAGRELRVTTIEVADHASD